MIIKSMSRKAPTFDQLIGYIQRGAMEQETQPFVRNVFAQGDDTARVATQFLQNHRYLPERKNGNALYHELIVLEPQPHLSEGQVERALHALAERYCSVRAPHQMAWGRVHRDTEFPHIHLMVSANAVRSERRVRLDRTAFANIQKEMERWQQEALPDLSNTIVYNTQPSKRGLRQTTAEGELIRRTQKRSDKQDVFEVVQQAILQAAGRDTLTPLLKAHGLNLYQRGKTWGVQTDQGRKYRLKTLGLEAEFERLPKHEQNPELDSLNPTKGKCAADLLRLRMNTKALQNLRDFDGGEDRDR